jgi:hypothetical protein
MSYCRAAGADPGMLLRVMTLFCGSCELPLLVCSVEQILSCSMYSLLDAIHGRFHFVVIVTVLTSQITADQG